MKKPINYIGLLFLIFVISFLSYKLLAPQQLRTEGKLDRVLTTESSLIKDDIALPPTLDSYVSEAILAHNADYYQEGAFQTESHVTLKTIENENTTMVYLMAYYAVYDFPEGKPELVSGSHIPVSLTFSKDDSGVYALTEYWEASDGSYYTSSIKEKFPSDVYEQAINTQLYAEQQRAACIKKAKEYIRQQQGI
ncbi:hypothetical protein PAECIP111893_01448 [Paenibacillus plantiphilus]|uniref:Uncharacterized protein n=1 Tax=Paenibacillus plantiphilus TaxID=2905650 RepID=A0ABN8G5Y2_9BACL|nr:hypothetical protein [Paenibacillus plantiphilus]CAH1200560.1 hypothetical protein PAECIP111893_01448 [Paenibacillus plantiphilus]